MIHLVSTWLLVAALFGAGLFNAIGMRATREGFVRWGYPSWWCWVAGGLELASAVLIALPFGRVAGLALGATVIVAASLTVLPPRIFASCAACSVPLSHRAGGGSGLTNVQCEGPGAAGDEYNPDAPPLGGTDDYLRCRLRR